MKIGDKVISGVLGNLKCRVCAVSRTDEKCLVEHFVEEKIEFGTRKTRLVTNWTDFSAWGKLEEKAEEKDVA